MRKIGLIFLANFVCLISFGQDLDKEFVKTNGIKSAKLYSHEISNGKIISTKLIKKQVFDKNGNIIEYYTSFSTHKKCEYDSAENIIKEVYYDPNGREHEIKTWEYDNKGRILKRVTYLSWVKRPYTSNYVYNEQGQNIEIYDINEYGKKHRITIKKYYDSGELFEERYEQEQNETTRIKRYDKCGNLIYKLEDIGGERKYNIKYVGSSCIIDSILQIDTVQYVENGKELTKITEWRLGKYWWLKEQNIKIFENKGNMIINEIYEYSRDSILDYSDISFFNEQGQLVESKRFYSGKSFASLGTGSSSPDSRNHIKYEYYDNGLKKNTSYFNENGIKTEYREHEYHDNGLRKFDYYFNEKGVKTECVEFQIEYY